VEPPLYGTVNVDELLLPLGEEGVAVPLLVTAEVAMGFVVVQVSVPLVQLEAPAAIVQEDEDGVRVPVMTRATQVLPFHTLFVAQVTEPAEIVLKAN
jgi:hypothetical protein